MDDIEKAITRYRKAKLNSAGESPGKLQAIEVLGRELDDSRVITFFAGIIEDADEYDLGRVEMLKVLQVEAPADPALRTRCAVAIATVLQAVNDDILVRQYAAMASAQYLDHPETFDALSVVLLDTNEDEDIRHNALSALEGHGSSQSILSVLRSLAASESNGLLGASAARVLTDWGAA